MEAKFSNMERLKIIEMLSLYTQDITSLMIIQKLREVLSFDEEEHEALGINTTIEVNGSQRVTWKKENDKTIIIGKRGESIIRESLEKMSREKKLLPVHTSLWEKFVGPLPVVNADA